MEETHNIGKFFNISMFSETIVSPRANVVFTSPFEIFSINPAIYLGPAPIKSRVKILFPSPTVKQSTTNISIFILSIFYTVEYNLLYKQ